MKSNLAMMARIGGSGELPNGFHDCGQLPIVSPHAGFQFGELSDRALWFTFNCRR